MLTILYLFYNVLWDKKNPKKVFKVLSCVIYKIIRNYVYIDYLASELKKVNHLLVLEGDTNKTKKSYDNILGIGIPDPLMNLMSCHGFLKNKYSVVILKCSKRMFEYYFSKGLTYFDCTIINLEKLPSEVKKQNSCRRYR